MNQQQPEQLFVGSGEMAMRMRSLDWSQTPLGGVETWSDSLKTAVQILLTELDRDRSFEETQGNSEMLSQDCNLSVALPGGDQSDAFRVRLTDALRPIADPVEVQATASRLLGEYLGANRVAYFEVCGGDYVVERDYVKVAEPIAGRYPIDSFDPRQLTAFRQGRTATSSDVPADLDLSPEQRSSFAAFGIGAYIGVPLVKEGKFVAGLAVHTTSPRDWTPDEIALTEEVAEQTWAAVERARAEAALRESEAKYRTLFESIDEGYFIADVVFDAENRPLDVFYLEANPAVKRITGIDIAGRTLREIDPNYESHWWEAYGRVAQTGIAERRELYAQPIDSWFSFYTFKIGDADSRRVGCVFQDITARKQAEIALQESEQRYRSLVTATSSIVWVAAGDGRILSAPAWEAFTGQTLEQYQGWGWFEMVHPDDRETTTRIWTHAIENKIPCEVEHRLMHHDGQYRHTSARAVPILDAAGNVREWIGTVTDISVAKHLEEGRKAAEAALRDSEQRYRTLFNSIDEAFCVCELMVDETGEPYDHRVLEINPAFETLTGLQQVTGKAMSELIPTLEPFWLETYTRVVRTGEPTRFESYLQGLDGWFDVYAAPLNVFHNQQFAVLFRNITERKRATLNAEFLATVRDQLAEITEVDDVVQTVGESLHRYLNISGCVFMEINERADQAIVNYHWRRDDVPSLVGVYALPQFVTREFLQMAQAGQPVVVRDVEADPRIANPEPYASLGVGAELNIPLTRNGEWRFSLSVFDAVARHWRDDEVALMEELAARIWTKLERTRAEREMQLHRRLLETVVNYLPTSVAIVRGYDLRFQLVNPAYQAIAPDREILGRTIEEVWTEAQPLFTERCRLVLEIGEPFSALDEAFEIRRAMDAPPELAYFTWSMHRIKLPDEEGWGLLMSVWETTDRKQAEAALRQSEAKYRTLFESIDQGFCLLEVLFDANDKACDYRYLEINEAFEEQSGLTNAVGKTIRELVPNIEPQWAECYEQVVKLREAVRFEADVPSMNRVFDIYAVPSGAPGQNLVSVLFTDITDRKRREAIIATDLENTRLLRDLSARLVNEDEIQVLYDEIMATAIALTQADAGTVQILDNATQDLILLAAQGFNKTMIDRFYRVNASSNTPCGIALTRGTRTLIDFDVPECDDPDGSLQMHVNAGYLSAQSTPLISRSGKAIGMVSTHWCRQHRPSERELRFLDLLARQAADLIEQRQTEAERQQILQREQAAREEAERANRIKDEFLAVLSHELRSPLNPILGWTRFLQSGKLDAVRQREALATIERNAKLQTQLIEDLLDISRIMQGKLSLSVAPVSLTFVIPAALETVRLAAEAKNIEIALDIDPEIAPVNGDAARLQQVVWNLLSNAVKFTPNGGQVTVELRQLNRLAQIRVIDTGKGINPQFLPYVFEYFRQEDGSTTRKFGGLGLGLAIVRQIVELHGGTVRAESQGENQGATLVVQLPTMQQTAAISSEPIHTQTDIEIPLKGIQILLVDDEPDTRELQTFLLSQSGARVTAVASGQEALQALEQSIPDVLVSDIGMAQMDGYLLIELLRSRPLNQGGMIPAIALTAYAAEVDRQRAIEAGFQTFITKPVEPETLVKAITTLLDDTQPEVEKISLSLE